MTKLSHGHGKTPGVDGCIMDFAVWRLTSGQQWDDNHPCFNAAITRAAQVVNDSLSEEGLVRLDRDFSERVFRARAASDSETETRILRRLALWAARDCEGLSNDPRVKACNDTTERFLAGLATKEELVAAAGATEAAAGAAAWAAWATAGAAAWATEAAAWATARAWAAKEATDDALLAFLDRLLDAWEKIAADEGALGDLMDFEGSQKGGS